MNVLVCEDNALFALALTSILDARGYEVLGPFATAREGLECLCSHSPNVVLLDFMLRDGTSAAVIEEAQRRGIPVVLLTGYAQLPEAPGLSRVTRLPKPVSDRELLEALEQPSPLGKT